MPSLHNLIINDLEIAPFDAAHRIEQTYEQVESVARHRTLDGTLLQQVAWRKLRTVISGSGRLPDGMEGIDFDSTLTIKCMAPLSISSATRTITLPATRRTDWAPVGYAVVGGVLVRTGSTLATNTLTIDAVSGASGYQAIYWPILTCYASPPSRRFSGRGTEAGWTLEAEEV